MKLKFLSVIVAMIYYFGTSPIASSTTFYLDNVTFGDGGTATGSFTYGTLSSGLNITTSPDGPFGVTYIAPISGVTGSAFSSGFQLDIAVDLGGGFTENLSLLVYQNFSTTSSNPLVTSPVPGWPDYDVSYESINGPVTIPGSFTRYVVSGSIDPTPLPAALPLFAAGLGALGLLVLRGKWKAAALAT